MSHVRAAVPEARLLVAGGKAGSGREGAPAGRARPGSKTSPIFAGERPAEEMPAYLLACDVLVSPRSRGTNTPLKIYQYLRSGKPIVATRLLTHTQVLGDETAILTGATAARVRRRHHRGAAGSRPRGGGRRRGRASWRRRSTATTPTSTGRARRARRCCRRPPASRSPRTSREQVRGRRTTATRVYADPATAQTFDRRRFGGPIGELVASRAGTGAGELRRPHQGSGDPRRRHRHRAGGADAGRAAAPASPASTRRRRCWRSRERRAAEEHLAVRFLPGDVHRLEFDDRAFDVVVSLRVLMHAADWRQSIAELCRVADQLVIIDYPSLRQFRRCSSRWSRRGTHALGARTEPYRVLSDGEIARELERSGFRPRSVHRQFVLPIALHKAIGSRSVHAALADALRAPRAAASVRHAGHARCRTVHES